MGRPKKSIDENLLESAVIDDTSILTNEAREKSIPDRRSSKWSEYVLSHLEEDEFGDKENKKFPRTDALPRLIERFIGPIVLSESSIVGFGEKLIAVHHLIVRDECYNVDRNIKAVGEANESKLKHPYSLYPAAIASTRAKGRSYKDVLQLKNVMIAEENEGSIDESEDSEGITSNQQAGIKNLCSRLKIDMDKFLKYKWGAYNDVREVTKEFAKERMAELNKYQQKELEIPQEFKL